VLNNPNRNTTQVTSFRKPIPKGFSAVSESETFPADCKAGKRQFTQGFREVARAIAARETYKAEVML